MGKALPTPQLIVKESVDHLFSNVPPDQLKNSLNEIIFKFTQSIDSTTDWEEFKIIMEDMYFLNQFIDKVQKVK